MDKIRAQEVLKKIDELLRWEAKVEEQKDQRFAELGKYLCEVRKHGYWRVGFRSFEHFLEAKFPDSRRKAYYLMSIHDHLKMIPTAEIEGLGWSKALELAKVARSEGRHFNSATWLHRAKESTKQELKEEVYKYFTGEDYEPYEMVYFKALREPAANHRKSPIRGFENGRIREIPGILSGTDLGGLPGRGGRRNRRRRKYCW